MRMERDGRDGGRILITNVGSAIETGIIEALDHEWNDGLPKQKEEVIKMLQNRSHREPRTNDATHYEHIAAVVIMLGYSIRNLGRW